MGKKGRREKGDGGAGERWLGLGFGGESRDKERGWEQVHMVGRHCFSSLYMSTSHVQTEEGEGEGLAGQFWWSWAKPNRLAWLGVFSFSALFFVAMKKRKEERFWGVCKSEDVKPLSLHLVREKPKRTRPCFARFYYLCDM